MHSRWGYAFPVRMNHSGVNILTGMGMCLTGNAFPRREWVCASPGMHIVIQGNYTQIRVQPRCLFFTTQARRSLSSLSYGTSVSWVSKVRVINFASNDIYFWGVKLGIPKGLHLWIFLVDTDMMKHKIWSKCLYSQNISYSGDNFLRE